MSSLQSSTTGYSPWGSYFGMFRDKYGIEWVIDYDPKYKGQQ
jgi:PhnB protein